MAVLVYFFFPRETGKSRKTQEHYAKSAFNEQNVFQWEYREKLKVLFDFMVNLTSEVVFLIFFYSGVLDIPASLGKK